MQKKNVVTCVVKIVKRTTNNKSLGIALQSPHSVAAFAAGLSYTLLFLRISCLEDDASRLGATKESTQAAVMARVKRLSNMQPADVILLKPIN